MFRGLNATEQLRSLYKARGHGQTINWTKVLGEDKSKTKKKL